MVGRQEVHPACKKTEWWGAGVVICLERGADLHMAQLMPLPLTVSCFRKIQIGFTFLVPTVSVDNMTTISTYHTHTVDRVAMATVARNELATAGLYRVPRRDDVIGEYEFPQLITV